MNSRPVSVSHLVFGLVFLGLAVMWVVGAATDSDAPDAAVLVPSIFIVAGAAGLVALVFNARNARIRAERHELEQATEDPATTTDHEYADTGVAHHEEQS